MPTIHQRHGQTDGRLTIRLRVSRGKNQSLVNEFMTKTCWLTFFVHEYMVWRCVDCRSGTAGGRQERQVFGVERRWSTFIASVVVACCLQRQWTTRLHVDAADLKRFMSSSICGGHVTNLLRNAHFSIERLSRYRHHVTAELKTRPLCSPILLDQPRMPIRTFRVFQSQKVDPPV